MSKTPPSQQPLGPLSVGNVVSAALVLYRSHLKLYFGIALQAYLWFLVPFLVLIPIGLILTFLTRNANTTPLVLLIIPIAIALFIFVFAKYLANSALISRLAFSDLVSKPETKQEARRHIVPRQWSFFRVALQVGFSLIGVYFLLGLLVSIVLGIIVGLIFYFSKDSSIGQIIGVLLIIAGVIGFLFAIVWFLSRWFIAEVPLAVEQNIDGGQSVARSWELTKNFVVKIQLIFMVAFLVTLPLLGVTTYIPYIFLLFTEEGSSLYWSIYALYFIGSLVGGVFILPFWQAIKAVLYYDLRSRKEGIGLQMRDNI